MIYLANPYVGKDQEEMDWRFYQARDMVAWYLKRGTVIFSPIVHCHELAVVHDLPKDFEFWQKYCLAMLDKADELLVLTLPRLGTKPGGVLAEIEHARKRGIPISYVGNEK